MSNTRLRHQQLGAVVLLLGLLSACGNDSPGQGLPGGGGDPGGDPVGIAQRPINNSCVAPELAPSGDADFMLAAAFPNLPALSALVYLLPAPEGDAWYALQQRGVLLRFENQASTSSVQTVIDLGARLGTAGEEGLLGLAFDPEFERRRHAYLYYSARNPRRSVVSRFEVRGDGSFDENSEQLLLEVPQPFGNHNGGTIAFGADGYLYIGLGDGGGAGDPQEHGENPQTLLGAMLRIDVAGSPPDSAPYAIPPDNPFADGNGGAPEVYAYGLRNPYRWSFDRFTDELRLADVGQNAYEEVNIIRRGLNYGWNTLEGFHCFDPAQNCDASGREPPMAEYPHSAGVSVTGGYVYRGNAIPGLRGRYVFGDFSNGNIWAINRDAGMIDQGGVALDTSLSISAFAEDAAGELYVLNYSGGAGEGIYQLVPSAASPPAADEVAQRLSETGCVNMSNPRVPAAGTVPYQPNATFWSDGAAKYRAAAIPDGTSIDISGDGDLLLPIGSVLIKHFERAGEIFESRLFYRHGGGWQGYSYRWNAERTEAFLLSDALDEQVAGQPWHYPSGAECDRCHTQIANVSLGVELQQLNGDYRYPQSTVTANQLDSLEHINWLSRALNESDYQNPLPDPYELITGDASAAQRVAKAYLHSNCAQCHRPGGPSSSAMDLRYNTPLAQMRICEAAATDESGAVLLAPGAPDDSVLLQRMRSTGEDQMPPLARALVDEAGVAVIDNWISQLAACPN